MGFRNCSMGLTGRAQINRRDELPILQKVQLDAEHLLRRPFPFGFDNTVDDNLEFSGKGRRVTLNKYTDHVKDSRGCMP